MMREQYDTIRYKSLSLSCDNLTSQTAYSTEITSVTYMNDDGVQTTIQELQQYVKIKRCEVTYFMYVTSETTAREMKRKMRQFIHRKCHDIKLCIPRYNNRMFNGNISFEQAILVNGETLVMTLRKPGTDDYELLEDVTGDYNTTTAAIYR